MRSSTKSELQQLREFWWLIAPRTRCHFCQKYLIEQPAGMTYGHRRHPPVDDRFTTHHVDHNRENNAPQNLLPCHPLCHRLYHVKVNNERRRAEAANQ